MPNPVDVKRGEYLQRGTLPLILLAAPLAHWRQMLRSWPSSRPLRCCGYCSPWLLNTEPQLRARGQTRRRAQKLRFVDSRGDFSLASGQSPAAGHSPHTAASHHLYGGNRVATAALALPVHTISWYFTADWGIPVPLLNDVSFSASGLALGGFMAIGWLVTVFAPQSMMIRLGGGVLRGLKHSRPAGAPSTEVGGAPPAPVAPAPRAAGAAPCCSPYGPSSPWPCARCRFWHADQLDAVRLERGGISHISHPHTWPLCIRYVRSVTLLQGIHLRSALGAVLLRPGHYDGAQTLKRLQGDSYVRSEASGQACHTR